MPEIIIKGLDTLVRDFSFTEKELQIVTDKIAVDIATEILQKADKNASGPNNSKKRKGTKVKARKRKEQKIKELSKKTYKQNKSIKTEKSAPYPVSAITGTFKKAHKMMRVKSGIFKVYGDSTEANYFNYVHNGTWKMKPRKTIYNAYDDIVDSDLPERAAKYYVNKAIK
jgi:hypothetical protein